MHARLGWLLLLALVASCGRIAFDPVAATDAAPTDAAPPDACSGCTLTVPDLYVPAGTTGTVTASGGTPPYTFALQAGVGAVDAGGTFSAPATISGNSATATVIAHDALGAIGVGTVTIAVSGTLDTAFGIVGGFSLNVTSGDAVFGIVVQSDGKIVLVGTADSYSSILLVRLTSDGALDTTFGTTGGYTKLHLGASPVDAMFGVVERSDGRLIVAGQSQPASLGAVAVASFTPDGLLDTTFAGGAGYVTTQVGTSNNLVPGLVLAPDNSVFVVGDTADNTTLFVVHVLADGTLDAGYGTGGVGSIATTTAAIYGLALQSDGKVVGCGGANSQLALFRLDAFGQPDASYGTGGLMLDDLSPGMTSEAHGCVIDPDDSVLVAANSNMDSTAALLRYTTSGARDATYNSSATSFSASGLAVARDAVGRGELALHPSDSFGLIRLQPDGSIDPTFNHGLIEAATFTIPNEWGWTVTIEPDGKLLVGGIAGSSLGVIRFWP